MGLVHPINKLVLIDLLFWGLILDMYNNPFVGNLHAQIHIACFYIHGFLDYAHYKEMNAIQLSGTYFHMTAIICTFISTGMFHCFLLQKKMIHLTCKITTNGHVWAPLMPVRAPYQQTINSSLPCAPKCSAHRRKNSQMHGKLFYSLGIRGCYTQDVLTSLRYLGSGCLSVLAVYGYMISLYVRHNCICLKWNRTCILKYIFTLVSCRNVFFLFSKI